MGEDKEEVGFPRRSPLRRFMQWLAKAAFWLLTDLEIVGEENFPRSGPLIVVANHFSFIDPAAVVRIAPWPLDFVGGAHMPHAPKIVTIIPRLWGYLPVYRGTGAHAALRDGEKIIKDGGVLGVFPEAGNWAQVLRPARPGAAFLAIHTGAKLLPIGLDGLDRVFPTIFKGRRPKVTFRIGQPFGPFTITEKGRGRREQIDEIGHEIMRHIAALIPPKKRGYYSKDPAIRKAAKGTEIYPWASKREGEVKGKVS
jgi:1-acyl-sn-glycerol-3-phosphate acyltransferase